MDAAPVKPIFSDPTLETAEPQRPFRATGLVALLFGLLSLGVLASGAFLFIPVLALLFALIALRPERDPQVIPAGRNLAIVGASLALFFSSWALARWSVQERYLSEEGEQFARSWLAVLEDGQREFAYELTLPPRGRQLESMSLAEFYQSNSAAMERYQGFLSEQAVQEIFNAEEPLEWELITIIGPRRRHGTDFLTFRFGDRSGQISAPADVILVRSPPGGLDNVRDGADDAENESAQWHVYDLNLVN